jgi:hypothetical protein
VITLVGSLASAYKGVFAFAAQWSDSRGERQLGLFCVQAKNCTKQKSQEVHAGDVCKIVLVVYHVAVCRDTVEGYEMIDTKTQESYERPSN